MVKRNLSAPFHRPIQLFYRTMCGRKKCPKIIIDKSITFDDTVRARFGYGWWSWESSRWSNIKCLAVNIDPFSLSPMFVMTACESTFASLALMLTLFTRVATNTRIHQTWCHSHHKGLRVPINPNYSYECCRPAAVTRRKVRPVHKLCRAGRTEFSMQFE